MDSRRKPYLSQNFPNQLVQGLGASLFSFLDEIFQNLPCQLSKDYACHLLQALGSSKRLRVLH